MSLDYHKHAYTTKEFADLYNSIRYKLHPSREERIFLSMSDECMEDILNNGHIGSRGGGYVIQCIICGKYKFCYYKGQLTCSKSCAALWKQRRTTYKKATTTIHRKCPLCHTIITLNELQLKRGTPIYCSPKHSKAMIAYRSLWYVCLNCGKIFKSPLPSPTCSNECIEQIPAYMLSNLKPHLLFPEDEFDELVNITLHNFVTSQYNAFITDNPYSNTNTKFVTTSDGITSENQHYNPLFTEDGYYKTSPLLRKSIETELQKTFEPTLYPDTITLISTRQTYNPLDNPNLPKRLFQPNNTINPPITLNNLNTTDNPDTSEPNPFKVLRTKYHKPTNNSIQPPQPVQSDTEIKAHHRITQECDVHSAEDAADYMAYLDELQAKKTKAWLDSDNIFI